MALELVIAIAVIMEMQMAAVLALVKAVVKGTEDDKQRLSWFRGGYKFPYKNSLG